MTIDANGFPADEDRHARPGRARQVLLPVVVFAAAVFLARFINGRQAAGTWLLWPYVGFCLATIVWVICCAAIGRAALRLLPGLGLRFRERVLFDFATGVLLFAAGLFLAGLFGLIRPPFFSVYPLVLGAIGLPLSFGDARRAWRHFRAARKRACLRPSAVHTASLVLGALGFTIVYLTISVADNTAFDARSYHLPIAEHFAAGGRIGRFPEGWYPGVLPHLASWLYTWPFTLRRVNEFGHVELAAHLELALFVATVFSAPLLVEALLPGRRARGSWAVFFLFPGLFLYDSNLSLAADHVLAFWAAPLALAVWRFAQRPGDPARGALAGLMFAGAALTKYQAVYLLIPAGLFILFVVARELVRARSLAAARGWGLRPLLGGPGALVLAAALASAPHWLANVVWYGNPVYPMLSGVFPSHPLVPGWPGMTPDTGFLLTGTVTEKVRKAAAAAFTFSFIPNDWAAFHRDLPVFGFLFTLTLPVLLVARGTGRARVLAAGTLLGVFIWYWTYHQDRYLQALLPWMVACTAVALAQAWASGIWARAAITLLVAVQVAWGSDVPWLPTHTMMHEVPALRALRRASSTFGGEDLRWRLRFDTGLEGLDRTLPKHAYVVLHEEYLRLGLNRRAIQDALRLQAGIDYRQLVRPDRVHDLLTSLGATHLVWNRAGSVNREISVSGELVFWGYALRYGEDPTNVDNFVVAKLPAQRPPPREPGLVAYLGCKLAQNVPLGQIDDVVDAHGAGGSPSGDPAALAAAADFMVLEAGCPLTAPPDVMASFLEAPPWKDVRLWVRR